MTDDESLDDEEQRMWRAFRKGFIESGEKWNGDYYSENPDAVERRLKARFEALYDAGWFDD